MTEISKAAERASLTGMIAEYADEFAKVLPTHIRPEVFVRVAQSVLRRNAQLREAALANPGSLMAALMDAARLGHEPGTDAYYLVPYGQEVQGIEGYRGVIERMYRAGAVASVQAEIVRERDSFEFTPGMDRPIHRVDWFSDRGPIIGAYAYAVFHSGATSRVVVINRDYISRVRAQSRGSNRPDSPWNRWEEAMTLKTVAHRLEPWVPTSTEYRREIIRAAAEARGAGGRSPAPTAATRRVVDADVVLLGEVDADEAAELGSANGSPEDDWPEPAQPGSAGIHP